MWTVKLQLNIYSAEKFLKSGKNNFLESGFGAFLYAGKRFLMVLVELQGFGERGWSEGAGKYVYEQSEF